MSEPPPNPPNEYRPFRVAMRLRKHNGRREPRNVEKKARQRRQGNRESRLRLSMSN